VILAPGEEIGEAEVVEALPAARAPETAGEPGEAPSPRLRSKMADLERQVIVEALERNDWRMAATARELGLERSHLYKKIKVLGITRPRPGLTGTRSKPFDS